MVQDPDDSFVIFTASIVRTVEIQIDSHNSKVHNGKDAEHPDSIVVQNVLGRVDLIDISSDLLLAPRPKGVVETILRSLESSESPAYGTVVGNICTSPR